MPQMPMHLVTHGRTHLLPLSVDPKLVPTYTRVPFVVRAETASRCLATSKRECFCVASHYIAGLLNRESLVQVERSVMQILMTRIDQHSCTAQAIHLGIMGNPEQIVLAAPELDPSFLSLSDTEVAFLHSTVSANEEELKTRLLDVQKRSYAQYPYPCIRGFLFVKLMMSSTPIYPAVLEAGKKGDTYFLDLGCCMGSDVRKLVQDGYPPSHVFACDLREEFIKLGYDLYRDADTCPIRFFSANVFDLPLPLPLPLVEPAAHSAGPELDPTSVTDLAQLRGALTHIYTGSLFHLFDEETQYGLALRLASLLKRTPGAVIFGRHQGLIEEGYIDDQVGRVRYGHSVTSWPHLWQRVFTEIEGAEFARRIVVEAELGEGLGKKVFPSNEAESYTLVWSVQIK